MLLRDFMTKIKFFGSGSVLIRGLPKILKYGDVLDLPDDVAEKLLKSNNEFKKVEPEKKKIRYMDIKKDREEEKWQHIISDGKV